MSCLSHNQLPLFTEIKNSKNISNWIWVWFFFVIFSELFSTFLVNKNQLYYHFYCFSRVHVAWSLFCVVFCRSLFVLFLLAIDLPILQFTYSEYTFVVLQTIIVKKTPSNCPTILNKFYHRFKLTASIKFTINTVLFLTSWSKSKIVCIYMKI